MAINMVFTSINNPSTSLLFHHQISINIKHHHYPFLHSKPTSKLTPNSPNFLSSTYNRTPAVLDERMSSQITDCNEKIRHFCELGNLREAVNMICENTNARIEVGTYCLVLQLCAEKRSLRDGRRVHSAISSNTLQVDSVLGAKLVFMYVTCGDLVEGRKIFDMIANEKVYLWNLLINEYSKVGEFEQGVYLYGRMKEYGVEPNEYTFSCVLKCFSGLGYVEEAEKIHGCSLKLRLSENMAVANSLISFYFKFGRVESAVKLFDEMPDRDAISWNSMISGYVSNGLPEEGVDVFMKMINTGVFPNLATMICVLAACADVVNIEFGKILHSYAVKTGCSWDLMFCNTLLGMYTKCGDLDSAICVFGSMGEKSIVSWTLMLNIYAQKGESDAALKLFYEMKDMGVKPNSFSVTSVLKACASSGSLEVGKKLHDYVKRHDMQEDLCVCNALMDMYVKCGSLEDAELVFTQMSERDMISWNTMISALSKNCYSNKALKLFLEMQHEHKPDAVTMSSILPACASLAAFERGKEIHGYILRNGYFSDLYVANALVDMYVKCGAVAFARSVFNMILRKDRISWTIMIAGYCMHGYGSKALATFDEMEHEGIEPNQNSLTPILRGCVHSGLLREGNNFFTIMEKDSNIELKLEHYICMIHLLANAGKLMEAYTFIEKMPLEPDATVWGALLQGCRLHHDVKFAEKVANHIFKLEPDNKAYEMLLENVYTEAKTWEKVEWLKSKISHFEKKKIQVCSWIEVKGKVQIFIAGNIAAFPESKKIDTFLKKLTTKMKSENYSENTNYTMINKEELKKEIAVCGHSEIAAIAFGVLRLAPMKTIRVTKNSRICHKCHEMAKFISKIYAREIIIRDSFRFHHFKDGLCTCRG